ncbi:hypothetical protein D7D52_36105 [Nocardia yunnanensis]|uniref:Uncharacterized protein n=1 Tax=Nocardia yunnanensis TaxID=2382165 RepID=A0A386ZMC1_9NOCA|nr:hypothetical protein D7D52_36105 [Nocardia yunnanensis]
MHLAHAGMIRTTRSGQCSPRTWGWSVTEGPVLQARIALPTHAGMVRHRTKSAKSAVLPTYAGMFRG